MFLSSCGKTPRDEGAAFVAPSATVQGDVVLKPGSTVWYGAVLRGDDGTLTIGKAALTVCGDKKRLCAEIDTSAPEYGERGQFRILKGY